MKIASLAHPKYYFLGYFVPRTFSLINCSFDKKEKDKFEVATRDVLGLQRVVLDNSCEQFLIVKIDIARLNNFHVS